MSYRIQFTITDDEHADLKEQAFAAGYPNIHEFCKSRALNGKSTYADLFKIMKKKIEELKPDEQINEQLNPGNSIFVISFRRHLLCLDAGCMKLFMMEKYPTLSTSEMTGQILRSIKE